MSLTSHNIYSFLLLFISFSFSATHFVATSGGNFSTISSAISTAVAGDTLVIQKLPLLAVWEEDLVIDKALVFLPDSTSEHFQVNGSVDISIGTGDVQFVGLELSKGDFNFTMTSGSGSLLLLNSTVFKNLNALDSNGSANVNLMGSTIVGNIVAHEDYKISLVNGSVNRITLQQGRILGSSIKDNIFIIDSNLTVFSEPLKIIANDIKGYIRVNSNSTFFEIRNNIVDYITVLESPVIANKFSLIANNEFSYRVSCSSEESYVYADQAAGNIYILNNTRFDNNSAYSVVCQGASSLTAGTIIVSYNYSQYRPVYPIYSGSSIQSGIHYTGSENKINTGHPDPEFMDLDLTQNDLGKDGGPHAWSNYWPSAEDKQKARVFSVKIPRKIIKGQTISIEAEAFDQ